MVRIDMDMPKSCMECDYCYKTYVGSVCRNGDLHDYVDRYTESRHPGCPLIDVKKGKWKRQLVDSGFSADWHCSECGWKTALEEHGYKFCPNCGADMGEDV